jgi:hypothetical protein
MFQPAQQEGAEFSALRIGNTQVFTLQQPGEELLGQILAS